REPRSPSPKDLELLDVATHLLRIAIERDRDEEALRRSEAYLTEAQTLTQTGSWALNPSTGKRLYWSEEMFRIFGLDPRPGVPEADDAIRVLHPEDRDRVLAHIEKASQEKSEFIEDYRLLL